jgi:putative salt-induced outer membrane protein YdiY
MQQSQRENAGFFNVIQGVIVHKRHLLLAVLFSLAWPAAANVSRLQLKNGDILTGTIKTQTAEQISLLLPYAGLVSISRREIIQIDTLNTPVQATLAATPALSSTTLSSSTRIALSADKTVQTEPTAIANATSTATSQGDVVHSEAELSTTATPALVAKPWSIELDVSASSRHGKQDSSLLNLVLATEYNHQLWRASLDSHFDYELKDQARKTHQYDINPSIDYFIQPRLFWRGSVEYQYNYLASDYRNLDLSTGPGYAVIQQPQLSLDLVATTGVKKAYFRDDNETFKLLSSSNQLNYNFAALEWDLKYRMAVWPIEFYSDGNLLHLLNQPIPYLYFDREVTANFGIRYRLTDQIRLSWSYQYNETDLEIRLPGLPTSVFDIRDFRQKLSIGATF